MFALLFETILSVSVLAQTSLLLFVIDGLQNDAAIFASQHGAVNLKFMLDNGVRVEEAYCTSPAPVVILPDGSRPWGTAAPPNVAMHTGTHLFESRTIDDIFLAARRAGIRSLFAGSADNYGVFTTSDFSHAKSYTDSFCIAFAIEHLRRDDVRLFSIHLQELRRVWNGPEEKLSPASAYQRAIVAADGQLGQLVAAMKGQGVWDSTYVVVASDHGMGTTNTSEHPPSDPSSWRPFMCFYGPGLKQGATIPYAESPDIALFIAHVLRIGPLRGHPDSISTDGPKQATGVLLSDLFDKQSGDFVHPRLISKYLISRNWKPSDDYGEYRSELIRLLSGSEALEQKQKTAKDKKK